MTSTNPKKLLIFAPYFPPRPRVGALRPYRFANYLKKFGWQVSVICIKDSVHELSDIEKTALDGVKIYELISPFDRTVTKPKSREKERASSKKSSGFAEWFDNQFPIDTWLPFFNSQKKKIREIIQRESPDVIFSTSDPWSGGYVIGKIAMQLGIKWVADFRDPWTLCGVRFKKKGRIAKSIDRKAERFMMTAADAITFTAKETQGKYETAYPFVTSKTNVIYNSFDLAVNEISKPQAVNERFDKLDIFFLGSFRELSTAEGIIQVLKNIKDRDESMFERIRIHSYGVLTEVDRELASQFGVLEVFQQRERVPSSEVYKELQQADLLLLSTKLERKDIVPAKLFDYLVSGKPIFSLVQNPEIETILSKTGTGVQFKTDQFDEAAIFLMNVMEEGFELTPELKKIEQYDIEFRARELDEILTKVVGNER